SPNAHRMYDAPSDACANTSVTGRPTRSARAPIAKRPVRLPMPINPTRPTARASGTPRSRAAADRCANGMNMLNAPKAVITYIQMNARLVSAAFNGVPGTVPSARLAAAGARRISSAAVKPIATVPIAIAVSAPRHCHAPIAAAASSGTTSVPAPMPALAMPAASPRRRVKLADERLEERGERIRHAEDHAERDERGPHHPPAVARLVGVVDRRRGRG